MARNSFRTIYGVKISSSLPARTPGYMRDYWLAREGSGRWSFAISIDIHIYVSMYRVSMIRKELVAASAEPLILSLLAKGESYGYAIIQEVKARSDGKLNWTDGMLYPVLHWLEHRGFDLPRWGESETGRKTEILFTQEGRQGGDGKSIMNTGCLIHGVLSGLKKEQYV